MLIKLLKEKWESLIQRFGRQRVVTLMWLNFVAVTALIIQILIRTNLHQSALLYILVPYGVSILIAWFRSYSAPKDKPESYLSRMVSATIFFIATSMVLQEGFICVLFFMPIYYLVMTLAYIWALLGKKDDKNKLSSFFFPVAILFMSLEGTNEMLSFSRDTHVVVTKEVNLSVDEVKANLAKPFDLRSDRHWMIAIFPMPYRIDAGSLNEGDIHRIYTRYHRWFVTNTHYGEAELLIQSVSENRVKTRMLSDTTFFSSYLKVYGTEINLDPISNTQTKISIRVDFKRHLDPAWYFQPLQKYGVTKMAEHLIKEVMAREN